MAFNGALVVVNFLIFFFAQIYALIFDAQVQLHKKLRNGLILKIYSVKFNAPSHDVYLLK